MNSDKVRGVHTQLRRLQDPISKRRVQRLSPVHGDKGLQRPDERHGWLYAAMFFGDKGTKIALDNDSTVGERNSRFDEALTSWQMGLIDTQGQFDAMASKNP